MKSTATIFSLLALALSIPAHAEPETTTGRKIVEAARSQVGKTVRYDPSYQALEYPGGDVPADRGVCTDVIIRALRSALDIDLQQWVHEDMRANFNAYPTNWGLSRTDRNIDHRRVPNLRTFFKRAGYELPIPDDPGEFKPGDIVTCTIPPHLPHIMIISDKTNDQGEPLIIHNIGSGTKEEDRIKAFPLTGLYRISE